MNRAVAPAASQTTLGLVVVYCATTGPMARPRNRPTHMSSTTLRPLEDRRAKFIAIRQPNPTRNQTMDQPGDRSRPAKQPRAKTPVAAATSHITWLNRVRL